MDNINDIQYFVKESQFEQALVDLLPIMVGKRKSLYNPQKKI